MIGLFLSASLSRKRDMAVSLPTKCWTSLTLAFSIAKIIVKKIERVK